ncbi:MAG: hypothetical protein BGN86_00495 [Caulobacterales bacterium 68-7]|nr:MAG: hypothetical protein BGN86_00495 [Caulobacterales bacterium 68-7]
MTSVRRDRGRHSPSAGDFTRFQFLQLALGGALATGGGALAATAPAKTTVTIDPAGVDPSAKAAYVNVRLSGRVVNTVVVTVMTRNGSDLFPDRRALSGVHYRPVNQLLVFRPGDAAVKTVTIPLIGGAKADQWFELIVPTEVQGAAGGGASARIRFTPGARNTPAASTSRPMKTPTRGAQTFELDLRSARANDSGLIGRRPCLRSRFSHGRTQPNNGELGFYTDPQLHAGTRAFDFKDGVLTLRTEKLRNPIRVGGVTYEYGSSVLTTQTMFSQTYGYFEWDARLSSAPGSWSGLWLLPSNGAWPPEIDVMEAPRNGQYRNADTNVAAHWMDGPRHDSVSARLSIDKILGRPVDLVKDFHRHAVEWRKDFTTWFLDDVEIFQAPTHFHSEAYALMDVTVGGWGGRPELSGGAADEMQIRSMRVWR